MPHYIPGTDSDTQPLESIAHNVVPRPVNIFVWDDGSLHEGDPPLPDPQTSGWARRAYYGGTIYGPLTATEVAELTTAGYGAYLTSNPKPEPQP